MPLPQEGEQIPGLDPGVPEGAAVSVAELHMAITFIDGLKSASLDDEDLDAETLEHLHILQRDLSIPLIPIYI